jgi:hypothetical protein
MGRASRSALLYLWRWIALIALLIGASLTFMQFAGWAAVYSGNYGLPSREWLLKEATAKAQIYGWACAAMTLGSVGIVVTLLPSLESEYYSGAIALMVRIVLASLLVLASGVAVCWTLSISGHYLR